MKYTEQLKMKAIDFQSDRGQKLRVLTFNFQHIVGPLRGIAHRLIEYKHGTQCIIVHFISVSFSTDRLLVFLVLPHHKFKHCIKSSLEHMCILVLYTVSVTSLRTRAK